METQKVAPQTRDWSCGLIRSVGTGNDHAIPIGVPPHSGMLTGFCNLIQSLNDVVDAIRVLDFFEAVCRFG